MIDNDSVEERRAELRKLIEQDIRGDLLSGNWLSFGVQLFFWASLALSAAAAIFGIFDILNFTKAQIGFFSAAAAGVTFALREARLQQRAQWHYRRCDGMIALRNRLDFELPIPPSSDNVAAISKDYSAFIEKMTASATPGEPAPHGSKKGG